MSGEWAAYLATRSLPERNALVERYAHLPKKVVAVTFRGAVRAGAANYVNQDDLVATGMIGLIRGVESFDPARGAKPETWLCQKIRSVILDDLRRLDHLTRADRRLANAAGDGFNEADLLAQGCEPDRAARVVRGQRMGMPVMFSAIEARQDGNGVQAQSRQSLSDMEIAEILRRNVSGYDARHVIALTARFLKKWSLLKTAQTMGYASRPLWLRKIFKLTAFPLWTDWHPPLADKARHGEKKRQSPTVAALLRTRASRPHADGALSCGARTEAERRFA